MKKVCFEKGAVSEAQIKVITNMVTEIINRHLEVTRIEVDKILQRAEQRIKHEILYEVEDFLKGDFSILTRGEKDE